MIGLVFEEVQLIGSLFGFSIFSIFNLLLKNRLLFLQLLTLFLKISFLFFQFCNIRLKLRGTLLRLKLLSHGKSQRAFVKCFICRNGHVKFVSDSHQKHSSFRAFDGHLTDDLIEALLVEFLSDGAYAWVSEVWIRNTWLVWWLIFNRGVFGGHWHLTWREGWYWWFVWRFYLLLPTGWRGTWQSEVLNKQLSTVDGHAWIEAELFFFLLDFGLVDGGRFGGRLILDEGLSGFFIHDDLKNWNQLYNFLMFR